MRQSFRIGESSQQVETTSLAGAYRTGFFIYLCAAMDKTTFLYELQRCCSDKKSSLEELLYLFLLEDLEHPEYDIDVKLCAFTASEMKEAEHEYEAFKQN